MVLAVVKSTLLHVLRACLYLRRMWRNPADKNKHVAIVRHCAVIVKKIMLLRQWATLLG